VAFDLLGAVRRRTIVTLMAGGLLAGCGSRPAEVPVASSGPPSPSPSSASASASASERAAVPGDYAWFRQVTELSKGFCFVWVRDVRPSQVLQRMGAKELERIGWQQMVGAGDGQSVSSDKLYFGASRLTDDWSLLVEDNGELGLADPLLRALSAGTTLVCLYKGARGRFLLLQDGAVQLDFDPASATTASGSRAAELMPTMTAAGANGPAERTEAAFALAERLTGVPLSLAVLRAQTYLFSVVPTGRRKSQ